MCRTGNVLLSKHLLISLWPCIPLMRNIWCNIHVPCIPLDRHRSHCSQNWISEQLYRKQSPIIGPLLLWLNINLIYCMGLKEQENTPTHIYFWVSIHFNCQSRAQNTKNLAPWQYIKWVWSDGLLWSCKNICKHNELNNVIAADIQHVAALVSVC